MHQTVLMDTDIHKNTKVDHIPDRSGQLHPRLQILHLQHILAKDRLGQLITGVAAGLGKLFGDIQQRGNAHTDLLRCPFRAKSLQFLGDGGGLAIQQLQQSLCRGIGLGMDACVIQYFLAFGDPQEAGALLKSLGAQLGHLLQLCPAGKGTILFPVGHDILRCGGSQTGDLLQKAAAGGIGIYAQLSC